MAVLLTTGPASDESAAIDDGHTHRSRRALDARVNQWLRALRRFGLSTGDRVAIVTGNRVETIEALLACLHAGLTAVPVNRHLTPAEIEYQLADSGSAVVVADQERAGAVIEAVRSGLPAGLTVLVFGDRAPDGCLAVEPLLAAEPATEPPEQCCGAVMCYTSGTTGAPKGVVNGLFTTAAPFHRVDRLLAYAGQALDVPDRGTTLLVGPWYHSAQLFFSLLPLLRGARLVMRERFDPAETLALIDREQVDSCHLVPTQFVRLLRLPEEVTRRFDGGSLRVVWHGGGACPIDVKRRMIDWWGSCLVEYYAATEGGVATRIRAEEWLARPGSVGRALPPTEVLIVDDEGALLPPGREGRVFLRRPTRRTFHYHNAPEKTGAAHLGPGIFTYGERGYLDGDGYLFLTGRQQDMIISGGVNIYPAEVDKVLVAHPAVRDAAVLGVPDDEYGERVMAVVELDPERLSPPEAEVVLDQHCRAQLAGFKVPRRYEFVAELPREPTGKLRKQVLRDRYGSRPAGGCRQLRAEP